MKRNDQYTPVARETWNALEGGSEVTCVWSGVGCGKTRSLVQVAHWLCETRRVIDPVTRMQKPMRISIIAESLNKIMQNFHVEAVEYFQHIKGATFIASSDHRRWKLRNGATISYRHYEYNERTQKSSIRGQKYCVMFSDETQELNEHFFEESLERCRLPNVSLVTGKEYTGQVVWSGQPTSNDRFLLEAKRRAKLGTRVSFVHCSTASNQFNPPDYQERQKRNCASMEEWVAKCQIEPGATYPAKDAYYDNIKGEEFPNGNLITLDVDKSHPTIISWDPGNNTTSILFFQLHQIKNTTQAIMVDEWHPDTYTDETTAIQSILNKGYNLQACVLDPFESIKRDRAAEGRTLVQRLQRGVNENPDGTGGGLGCQIIWNFPSFKKPVKEGIYRTRARICDIDGNRTILINRDLWDQPKFTRGIKFSLQNYKPDPATGAPDKRSSSASNSASHCCDALRYFVLEYLWDSEHSKSTPVRIRPPKSKPKATPRFH